MFNEFLIVSENFSLFYKQERRRRMVQERRAALEKAHMEGRVMDYGAVREDKAAQIIQERSTLETVTWFVSFISRFRGRVSVRKSQTSLRVHHEYEDHYRRGSRHRKSRVSSEDQSIHEDQPPYFKRRFKVEDDGNLNGGFTQSASIDGSLSPHFGKRHHNHHHQHQHR